MVNPAYGFQITPWDVRVINRTGATLALGDIAMFDLSQIQAETDTHIFGDTGSWTVNLTEVKDTAEFLKYAIFAIATESIADNETGVARLRGRVPAKVVTAGIAAGDGLAPKEDVTGLLATDSAGIDPGDKVIGIADETIANGAVGSVLFDGVNGFGSA